VPTRSDLTDYGARRRELLGGSAPGAGRRRGLAALTDAWLREIWAEACASTGADPETAALVAVGGYGRGELSPGSDLDLVLLHADRGAASPGVADLADKVWYLNSKIKVIRYIPGT
jgi:[protein-PII] uridylyltransferase